MPEIHCAINTFCAKQPILDAGQKIWGYEYLYRHEPHAQTAQFSDADTASLKVTAESLRGAVGKGNVKICVNFTARSVIDGVPYALPPELTVIEIPDCEEPTDEYLDSLHSLRRNKYTIALDTVPASRHSLALAHVADILKVDILQTSGREQDELLELGHKTRAQLLAKRVETFEVFRKAGDAGFSLFQGFFFRKPELQSQRTLTSMENTRLRLFRILQNPEPDFGALGEVIQADVSLSYRLLSLLNSPAFKLVRHIESVGQALVLLGWQQLKNWLLVVILTDLMPADKCPELIIASAQRAKFFELASQNTDERIPSETLFMLGLFSLLEPLMGMPMSKLVHDLPLDDLLKEALCGTKNAYFRWLDLAENFETLNWDRVISILADLQLNTTDAAGAYHAANLWANTMLTLL